MIEGIVIVIVGTMLNFAGPAHDLLSSRRQTRHLGGGPLLARAYPFASPNGFLEDLVARADAALEQDKLLCGVAGVTVVYDQAVAPR